MEYLFTGKKAGLIDINKKALELDPSSPIAITNIAEIFDNEYNFKEAEEKIRLALEYDPSNLYVLRNAGRFYTIFGESERSILYCKQALQIDPNNGGALFYMAKAYFYAGLLPEAWTTLKKYQICIISFFLLKKNMMRFLINRILLKAT